MRKLALPKLELDIDPAKTLYAGAGAADLAVEAVKEYAEDVTKRVSGYQAEVVRRVAGYQKDVATRLGGVQQAELRSEVRTLPGKVQAYVAGTRTVATSVYEGLAQRGVDVVARLRGDAVTADAAVTPVAEEPAPVAEAPAAPAKKAPAKKAPAARKPAARKPAAKKAAAKKTEQA